MFKAFIDNQTGSSKFNNIGVRGGEGETAAPRLTLIRNIN